MWEKKIEGKVPDTRGLCFGAWKAVDKQKRNENPILHFSFFLSGFFNVWWACFRVWNGFGLWIWEIGLIFRTFVASIVFYALLDLAYHSEGSCFVIS